MILFCTVPSSFLRTLTVRTWCKVIGVKEVKPSISFLWERGRGVFGHRILPETRPLAGTGAGAGQTRDPSAVRGRRVEDRTCELRSDWYHPDAAPKHFSGTPLAAAISDWEAELQVKVRRWRFRFIRSDSLIHSDSLEVVIPLVLIYYQWFIHTESRGVIHFFRWIMNNHFTHCLSAEKCLINSDSLKVIHSFIHSDSRGVVIPFGVIHSFIHSDSWGVVRYSFLTISDYSLGIVSYLFLTHSYARNNKEWFICFDSLESHLMNQNELTTPNPDSLGISSSFDLIQCKWFLHSLWFFLWFTIQTYAWINDPTQTPHIPSLDFSSSGLISMRFTRI